MSSLPVIVIGAGGHARVVVDALIRSGTAVLGLTTSSPDRTPVLRQPILGDDSAICRYSSDECELVLAIGSVGGTSMRQTMFEKFKLKGYRFACVVHPAAIVAEDVELGEGVQIMAAAVVQSGSRIGANTIINTHASVDHDCTIGAHSHIAPGAVLSGNVCVGAQSHFGVGAVAIQGVSIEANCVIGAGAVVLRNVPANSRVVGVWAGEGQN